MFKAIKYIFLANLFTKAKKSVYTFFVALLVMVVSTFILNDVIEVSDTNTIFVLIATKWFIILTMLTVMGFSIFKILSTTINPLSSSKPKEIVKTAVIVDTKKVRILNKEKLTSRSEQIMNKYTST